MNTDGAGAYLQPTPVIDADHPDIIDYARRAVVNKGRSPQQVVVALYDAVRDPVLYDPCRPFYRAEHYRASSVLRSGRGFCVTKAVLLCALGRSVGIPSRLGFADVRNHLAPRELVEMMGSDLFVYHGYTEFLVNGRWVKATPAFNASLCRVHQVPPLEFDGINDSVFQACNQADHPFMEYVRHHGSYADVPLVQIVRAWEDAYGKDRVAGWMRAFDSDLPHMDRSFPEESTITR